MKLLIDIPEEVYKLGALGLYFDCYSMKLHDTILSGIPIPDNVTNGEWVDQYNDGNWHCSKCGAIVEKDEQINHNWYFCYHCGAKMRGAE